MSSLPNKEFRKLVPKLREKDFYKSQEQRKISWPEYNENQIEDLTRTMAFIRDSVNSTDCLDTTGCVGRPLTNPRSLAKAILFCEMVGLTERNAQGWLRLMGSFMEIYEELDDRVIGEAYVRPEVTYILKQVFEKNKSSDGRLSGDGTGLETSRRQNYESTKKKDGEYMTSIIDSREIVQSFDISGVQECKIMHYLLELVTGKTLALDAGFNDRNLAREIVQKGMIPYIFPKKNNKLNGSPSWKNMYLSLLYDTFEWLKEYHQRSHTESFHSSFKRVFGILRKIRFEARFNQVIARIIIHNHRRLSYFKNIGM